VFLPESLTEFLQAQVLAWEFLFFVLICSWVTALARDSVKLPFVSVKFPAME